MLKKGIKRKYDSFVPRTDRNLSIILKSLVGRPVAAELKNNVEVIGELLEADEYMNFTLKNVQESFPNGRCIKFDEMYVKGTSVRYVHLPEELNMSSHVMRYIKDSKMRRRKEHRSKMSGKGAVDKAS